VVRKHEAELSTYGLPVAAFNRNWNWLLFLDHGTVQSPKTDVSRWWSVTMLARSDARRLHDFSSRVRDQCQDLVRTLHALSAGDGASCRRTAFPGRLDGLGSPSYSSKLINGSARIRAVRVGRTLETARLTLGSGDGDVEIPTINSRPSDNPDPSRDRGDSVQTK